jgi:putative tryptophan/tyrosine transport system substrate-binding protein
MMRKIVVIITLVAICVVSALYLSRRTQATHAEGYTKYRVAFFVPAVHPCMDDIERGVKEHLCDRAGVATLVETYNANGNRTLLRAQAEEIVQGNYDAIVTVGAQCSQVTHELLTKKQSNVPLVFCAIDDPERLGLIHTPQRSDDATGVLSTSDYARQLQSLIMLKPTIKRILLVFDPTQATGFETDRKILQREAQKLGLVFETAEVINAHDIAQKVPSLLPSTDVVLVLTDHTVVAAIDMLVTLCNRYQVLLYTSELNSVDKGAALAFGVTEYDYGATAAQLVCRILLDHHKPFELPVIKMESQKIKINTKTAPQQGLMLDEAQLQTLRAQGAIIV